MGSTEGDVYGHIIGEVTSVMVCELASKCSYIYSVMGYRKTINVISLLFQNYIV